MKKTVSEYTLEYADGFYIEKGNQGVIDFTDPTDKEFAEFVCDALNKADKEEDAVYKLAAVEQLLLEIENAITFDTEEQAKASPYGLPSALMQKIRLYTAFRK